MGLFRRLKSSKKKRIVACRRLLFEPLETRNLMALDLAAIGGTAFVDLTGNGLTGDDTRVNGATVELYRDNGDSTFSSVSDTLLGTTTANASGVYRFASTNAGGLLPANTLTVANYFVRQLPVAGFSPPAAALVAITSANINGTTVETVDTFDTTEQVVTANPFTPTASSAVAAPEAIGGERDVFVELTSVGGNLIVQIDSFNSNIFAFELGNSSEGNALIQYDGPDGNATVLNATGLGGVRLSDGDVNAGLLLATQGEKVGGTAVLRVYTNATDFSTTTILSPDSLENIFVPFSDFVLGGGAGATFTTTGAIELLINGGVPALDATVAVLRSLKPNEATSNLENLVPSIEIVKFTNGQDANTATGPVIAVGGTATFAYVVTNSGTVALGTVVVRDDNGTTANTADDFSPTFQSGDTDSDNQLDVTETWVYQATRVVTFGAYSNIATVTGDEPNSTLLSATDPSAHVGVNRLSKRRFIASGN